MFLVIKVFEIIIVLLGLLASDAVHGKQVHEKSRLKFLGRYCCRFIAVCFSLVF